MTRPNAPCAWIAWRSAARPDQFVPVLSLEKKDAYDPGRREALLAIGATVVAVALLKSDALAKRQSPYLIRPPGVRETNPDVVAFTKCTRCNECMRVCPTGGLQPSVFEAGLEGLGAPILVPRLGYCDYSCNACGQACPVQAIPPLALEKKRKQVIGLAYIDQNHCIPWSDHQPCLVCEEMCPLPKKAIQFEKASVWGPDGTQVTIQLPHVLRDLCIGCGICEYKCPVCRPGRHPGQYPQGRSPILGCSFPSLLQSLGSFFIFARRVGVGVPDLHGVQTL